MTNAKTEFLELINNLTIKCAIIIIGDNYNPPVIAAQLKVGHTEKELSEFLNKINVEYDSGYGVQELFGTVWFTDNTWAERSEYDGSEWWEHKKLPEIPYELLLL